MNKKEKEKLIRELSDEIWNKIKDYSSPFSFDWKVTFIDKRGNEISIGE